MTDRAIALTLGLLVAALSIAPAAVAKPAELAEPNCRDRYMEIDLGPVEVVSEDSCSYEVRESDDGEGPAPAATLAQSDLCDVSQKIDCEDLRDEIRRWITCPGPNPLCWNGGPR